MRGYIKLFLIIVFVFFISGILVYFIVYNSNEDLEGFDNLERFASGEKSGEDAVENELADLPSETVVGGGAGGGGGSGGGDGGAGASGGASGCTERQIAYALKNFVESADCNEFQGSVCVKKIMNCSLEVYNLDDNTNGIFGIRFSFLEEGSVFDYLSKEFNVGAGEHKIFEGVLGVESAGEDGRANKNLYCSFNTEKVPKEQVC